MTWRDRAACRDSDPGVFHPSDTLPGAYDEARKVCAGCPVIVECGDEARSAGIREGMWGGLSPRERRGTYGDRPFTHGTNSGREARNAYQAAYKRRRRAS